jgi:hypothetical protein
MTAKTAIRGLIIKGVDAIDSLGIDQFAGGMGNRNVISEL